MKTEFNSVTLSNDLKKKLKAKYFSMNFLEADIVLMHPFIRLNR